MMTFPVRVLAMKAPMENRKERNELSPSLD